MCNWPLHISTLHKDSPPGAAQLYHVTVRHCATFSSSLWLCMTISFGCSSDLNNPRSYKSTSRRNGSMGITASAPLRWSSPIKRSGTTGSPDPSNSQDISDHSKINSTVRDAVSSDTSSTRGLKKAHRFITDVVTFPDVNQHPESLETPAPTSRSVLADPKRCLVTQEAGPSVVPCYLFNPRLWRYNGMVRLVLPLALGSGR